MGAMAGATGWGNWFTHINGNSNSTGNTSTKQPPVNDQKNNKTNASKRHSPKASGASQEDPLGAMMPRRVKKIGSQ